MQRPEVSGSLDERPMERGASDLRWMLAALAEARAAFALGEVPVGGVIVRGETLLARAYNRTIADADPTAHAESLLVRAAAGALGRWRLDDCTLYVTLEPCAMCAGAMVLARLQRVVFGAWDEKAGMAGSIEDLLRHPRLNHSPEVTAGVLADECAQLLRQFFRERRTARVDSPNVAG